MIVNTYHHLLNNISPNKFNSLGLFLEMTTISKELPFKPMYEMAIHTGVTFVTENNNELAILYLIGTGEWVTQFHVDGVSVPAMNGLILSRDKKGDFSLITSSYISEIVTYGDFEIFETLQCQNLEDVPYCNAIKSFALKDKDGNIRMVSNIPLLSENGEVLKLYPLRLQYSEPTNYCGGYFDRRA